MKKINVIAGDSQNLVLKGLQMMLSTFDNIELVGQTSDGQDLLDLVREKNPDVVLVDVQMPVLDGKEVTKSIRATNPTLKTLLLTPYDEERIINQVLENGANGYLLKSTEAPILKKAIEGVVQNGFYFNEYVFQTLSRGTPANPSVATNYSITERDLEVLQLTCKGHTSDEIARKLFFNSRTIEGHQRNLLAKTGVKNTAGLIVFALKNSLVQV